MKSGFWKTDWFLGVAVVIVIALFARTSDLIPSLERKAYDLGVAATSKTPSDKIAVIAIDQTSLDNIGRWPWSRKVLADMTDKLVAAKAKVIAYTVLFSEPQIDPGYVYVTKLLDMAAKAPAAEAPPTQDASAPAPAAPAAANPMIALLKEAEQELNTDRKLAESFAKAGNVVPMMLFEIGIPQGKPDKPLPEYVQKNNLPKAGKSTEEDVLSTRRAEYPIESIGIGHGAPQRDT